MESFDQEIRRDGGNLVLEVHHAGLSIRVETPDNGLQAMAKMSRLTRVVRDYARLKALRERLEPSC